MADRSSLLSAGAKSYPQALEAINEFGLSVLEVVEKVANQRKTSLAKTFSVPIDELKITRRVRPNRLGFSGSVSFSIGIAVKPSKLGWKQYHNFHWEDSVFGFGSSIKFLGGGAESATRNTYTRLAAFHPKWTLGVAKGELYLWRVLKPVQMAEAEELIGEVIDEWTRLWKKGGGLKISKG